MNTELVIYQHLRQLGVPANLKGYVYLQEAIRQSIGKHAEYGWMTKQLYPSIAKKYGTTASRVERAMRHAVEFSFNNTDSEILHQYFGNTISSASGKLTNSQFIASVAEYIRLEVSND